MLVRSETSGFRPYKQPSVGLPWLPWFPAVQTTFGWVAVVQTTFGWVAVRVAVAVGLPCWVAVVQPSVGLPSGWVAVGLPSTFGWVAVVGLPSVDDLRCQCDHFEMGLFDLLRKRPTRAQAKLPLDAHGVGDLIEAIGDFGLE